VILEEESSSRSCEFEREIMLERQKEGIAKAHSEGKCRGRAPTARAKADQVFALDCAGETREAIAKEVGISLVSVYRILRTRKNAEKAPVAPPITRGLGHVRKSAHNRGGATLNGVFTLPVATAVR
jgi:Helix-turn-helix domain of resolvase